MTLYFDPIINNDPRSNDAAIWNDPMRQLSDGITAQAAAIAALQLNNSAAVFAQINNGSGEADTSWAVDNLSGTFLAGATVVYVVAGVVYTATVAANTAASPLTVTAAPPVTIPDNTVLAMVPPGLTGKMLESVYNVKAYGATGDGATDDAAAIQAAIDAAPASGAIIDFPTATYAVGTQIQAASNLKFRLNGSTLLATSALTTGGANAILDIDGDAGIIENVIVEDGIFDGIYPTRTSGSAVTVVSARDVKVRDCQFVRVPGTGVSINLASFVWVENNLFDTIFDSGVRWNDSSAGLNSHLWVRNNTFKRTNLDAKGGRGAVAVHGNATVNQKYLWIDSNHVSDHLHIGMAIDMVDHAWITNNVIDRKTISLVNDAWKWTRSGAVNEIYYLEIITGGLPVPPSGTVFKEPAAVRAGGSALGNGSGHTLSASQYDYGDFDTLGYSTLYVRLSDDSDPDSQADDFVEADYLVASGEGIAFTGNNISVAHNKVRGQGGSGIAFWLGSIADFDNVHVVDNTCDNNENSSGAGNGISVVTVTRGATLNNLRIEGNTCRSNIGNGLQFYKHSSSSSSVSAATKANPCVVTANNHGLSAGQVVSFTSVGGMTQLNSGTYTVANPTTHTFELSGIDSTSYGTYTSGGTVWPITTMADISVTGNILPGNTAAAINIDSDYANMISRQFNYDDTGLVMTTNNPPRQLIGKAGVSTGTESTEVLSALYHNDGSSAFAGVGSSSEAYLKFIFGTNAAEKYAAVIAEKLATFANTTGLSFAVWGNPGGGATEVISGVARVGGFGPASSAYDGPHLIMGTYHLWIDNTGDLRVKNGAPSTHDDGTIVGTQS